MDITQEFANANFIITGYQSHSIQINNTEHTKSLIVSSDTLITPWEITAIEQLNKDNLEDIFTLEPEIVIFGTGEKLTLPHPEIVALFAQHKIGIETMDTFAACRTYGILIAEGRKAVAALIFPE